MKRGSARWWPAAPAAMLLIAAALLISSCSTPMGDPEEGRRWYSMNHCDSCHGGSGDDGKAPVVRNPGMGFWRFKRIIRNAGSPIMPKYPEEKISDREVADIYAFLKAQP